MKYLLLALLLCASAVHAAPKDGPLIAKGKAAAAYNLKDPDSAKFRNVVAIRGVVCGEINAKNSMGGYVGFRRFISLDGEAVFDNDSFKFEETWGGACIKNPKPDPSPTSWGDKRLAE